MYQLICKDSHFLPHSGCDVELVLVPGKVLTLVGKNGVGKSTLLHHFFQQYRRSISLIEQKRLDPFYDRKLSQIRRIWENVPGVSSEVFEKLWKEFSFDKKEKRLQSQLSGGESQALKLCLGLSIEKDIYFLDEPSQYLDQHFKHVVSDGLQELILKKKAVLMVEHDLDWPEGLLHEICELEVKENQLIKGKSWIHS